MEKELFDEIMSRVEAFYRRSEKTVHGVVMEVPGSELIQLYLDGAEQYDRLRESAENSLNTHPAYTHRDQSSLLRMHARRLRFIAEHLKDGNTYMVTSRDLDDVMGLETMIFASTGSTVNMPGSTIPPLGE